MSIEEIIDNLELYTVGRPKKVRLFMTVEELQNLIDEIKALKRESCDDVVSRKDIEECDQLMEDINGDTVYAVTMSDIRRLPSVIPQPKIGYWITKEAYSEDKAMGFTEQIVCSNCDMQNSYFSEWDECKNPISKTFIRSKFCPNCGAKMQEMKNDNR